MKRRNFLSGLLAAPLALKARLARFFGRKPVEPCSVPMWDGFRPARQLLQLMAGSKSINEIAVFKVIGKAHCSLPLGHKGPHAFLN